MRSLQWLFAESWDTACLTDKVKLIPPTGRLSTTSSRIRSGLIAIIEAYYLPESDGVPRTYREIDSVTRT